MGILWLLLLCEPPGYERPSSETRLAEGGDVTQHDGRFSQSRYTAALIKRVNRTGTEKSRTGSGVRVNLIYLRENIKGAD
jgi:hypothetical protein